MRARTGVPVLAVGLAVVLGAGACSDGAPDDAPAPAPSATTAPSPPADPVAPDASALSPEAASDGLVVVPEVRVDVVEVATGLPAPWGSRRSRTARCSSRCATSAGWSSSTRRRAPSNR